MEPKIIKLPTGRKLAYADFGDPNGTPLFFFHGWPSSRNAAQKFDTLCKKLNIRMISPDRPGIGLSDFQENRALTDWPDDVIALANHLNINKFAILGVSGGGPYAAVCGYKIPDKITKLGIAVGLGPIVDKHSFDGITRFNRFAWSNFDNPILRKLTVLFQYFLTNQGKFLHADRFFFTAKSDHKIFLRSELRKSILENIHEAFRQGVKGAELDLKIYAENWGYILKRINSQTFLWYGADDKTVSVNMGKYYHKHIKGSILKIYPDEGHLVTISHAEEILGTLTS